MTIWSCERARLVKLNGLGVLWRARERFFGRLNQVSSIYITYLKNDSIYDQFDDRFEPPVR